MRLGESGERGRAVAASSPRKPRRSRGRHRKPTTFPKTECGRWLRVGVVGTGLAAAIACSQGVAAASTDDSSPSGESSSSADSVRSTDDKNPTKRASPSGRADDDTRGKKSRTSEERAESAGSDTDTDTNEPGPADDPQQEDPDEVSADPDEVNPPPDDNPEEASGLPPVDSEPPAQQTEQTQTADTRPPENYPEDASDLAPAVESEPSVQQTDQTDATGVDQPRVEPTRSRNAAYVVESQPTAGDAPIALAAVSAAAPPAPGTGEHFLATLQRAVNRLAYWPGLPRNFVDITNYQTDRSLDAANDQLDGLILTALLGSPARWLPDLLGMVGAFVAPVIPNSTFTDALNAMGDFLNRAAPPFKISDGAGALGVITPYKIMGAAVVGTATVLQDMLNGIYDPEQWAIDVIKTTTGATVTRSDLTDFTSLAAKVVAAQAAGLLGGDGGAFNEPERALNLTLPTWTAAQVNPFTVVTYVAVVAMYKRFQEMAVLTTFTTSTTYDSWHYANLIGLYAAGTFHAVDPDGNPVDFFGVSQGGTYISEVGGATVTINTADGGFTYTPWFQSAAFLHRSTSENPEDRYDTVKIPVKSADGVEYTLTFKIEIVGGSNANPTANHTVGTPDALGVVKGKVTGSDTDGDTLTYSLVDSSVNGASGNSAYTKNGAGNGGIVTLNATTGDFTYVSSSTAGAAQTFQVQVSDGHHGSVIRTVTVTNTTSVTPAGVNTSTPYVVTGSVPGSTNYPGVFTSYALGAAPAKGNVTSFNPTTGTFTYNSTAGRTAANDDVVTVIATDANGRTVTLQMAVKPTVTNNVPVVVSTTTDKGSTSTSKWRLDTLTGENRMQTTTGKITATDADGDTLTYSLVDSGTHAAVTTTTDGGNVTFNADGSYAYTITKNKSYFHAAAKVGASAADVSDTFTVAVTDNFTGSVAYTTVTMSTYAVNSAPTYVSSSGVTDFLGLKTVSGIKFADADGDTIGTTRNPSNGNPGYFAPSGFTAGTNNVQSGVGALVTFTGTYTVSVQDGYYMVTNGVVTGNYAVSPARSWS